MNSAVAITFRIVQEVVDVGHIRFLSQDGDCATHPLPIIDHDTAAEIVGNLVRQPRARSIELARYIIPAFCSSAIDLGTRNVTGDVVQPIIEWSDQFLRTLMQRYCVVADLIGLSPRGLSRHGWSISNK